jgi:hypothetical protein
MNAEHVLAKCFIAAMMLAGSGLAQEKPKPVEEVKPVTPVKVQVVFSEFEGEKKTSSLPYLLFVSADERTGRRESSLRMGLRVPVVLGTKDGSPSTQYMDVGTDLDCIAQTTDDGRFKLGLSLRRSSIYSAGPEKKSLDWNPGDAPLSGQPIVRQFSASLNLLVRDGQTVQNVVATDPVSGRVLKVDVTLNIVK